MHVIIGVAELHRGQTTASSAGYDLTKVNGDKPCQNFDAAGRQAAQVSHALLRGINARRVIQEHCSELNAAVEDVACTSKPQRPPVAAALANPVREGCMGELIA